MEFWAHEEQDIIEARSVTSATSILSFGFRLLSMVEHRQAPNFREIGILNPVYPPKPAKIRLKWPLLQEFRKGSEVYSRFGA